MVRTRKVRGFLGILTFFAFFSMFPPLALTEVAQAMPSVCPVGNPSQGWYRGYFSNRGYSCGDDLFAVLNDGLPNNVDTKQEFIDFVYNMNVGTRNNRSDGESDRNFTGTSYLVQTMRGTGDHAFPDDADLADWRARLDNPGITVTRAPYSAAVNSARMNVSGPRDVMSYYGDGVNYDSLIFWYNGNIVYVVKYACANPLGGFSGLPDPINFELTPTISASPQIADSGAPVTVRPVVTNSGSTASTGARWELSRFNLDPTDGVPGAGTNGTAPVSHYGNGAITIDSANNTVFPVGVSRPGDGTRILPDVPVGTRVCFALSVRPVSQSNGNWRHSPPFCITISKKPKVQVLGGDLIIGRDSASNEGRESNVDTSVSTPSSGGYYGSWTEYAIVPSGTVRGMASGSAYVGGAPTNVLCSLSLLTFTNGGDPGCVEANIGNYTHTSTSPNVAGRFPISATTPRITDPGVTLSGMSGLFTTARGALTVTGGADIGASDPGQWIVINAKDTDITITGDINYSDTDLTDVEEIPQVVLIAKNIIIADNVQNVDAWLIAVGAQDEVGTNHQGNINTCGAGSVTTSTLPHAGQCGLKLTINGPVSANHLYLRRTAGADPGTGSGNPAEVFNLRADSYIWASSYSPGTGRLPTVKVTELPPRF